MKSTITDLMRRNLLDVFDAADPNRRAAAIAEIYAEDVVWHEPDRINRGRTELENRAAQLRAQHPTWAFRPDGPVSVLDDLGHLGFTYGPAGQIPVITGMDIAHCNNGVIVELYTLVNETARPS